jgi:hypothetical protein
MEPIFVISGIMAALSVGGLSITLLLIATGKVKS